MEAMEAILTRRSTRKMKSEPVPRALIERVIEAGRFAPSGSNSQTTHLIVIERQEILSRLAALVEREFAAMEAAPDMYRSLRSAILAAQRGGYVFHYGAPVLIVTANRADYGNAMADSACVLENMMIAANALDLGSCWINQLRWLRDHAPVRACMEELGMGPEETVTGGLILGYPDTEDGQPPRTPLPRTGNPVTWVQ